MRRTIPLALGLALAAAPALAQGGYRFEITPQVQYRFGGTISGDNNAITDADLDVRNSVGYGLTFDIPLSSGIQLELLASHQPTELRFSEGIFGGNISVADFDVTYYHVGVLFQGTSSRVSPFFVASAGGTHLAPDIPGASSEDRFSLSLGGGVKVFFSDNVGMRFEGRGFWTALDQGTRDSCHHGCYWDDYYREDLTQGMASMGLIFAW